MREFRGPSAYARTDPSGRLVTYPTSRKRRAVSCAKYRKPTPWTRPKTRTSNEAMSCGGDGGSSIKDATERGTRRAGTQTPHGRPMPQPPLFRASLLSHFSGLVNVSQGGWSAGWVTVPGSAPAATRIVPQLCLEATAAFPGQTENADDREPRCTGLLLSSLETLPECSALESPGR